MNKVAPAPEDGAPGAAAGSVETVLPATRGNRALSRLQVAMETVQTNADDEGSTTEPTSLPGDLLPSDPYHSAEEVSREFGPGTALGKGAAAVAGGAATNLQETAEAVATQPMMDPFRSSFAVGSMSSFWVACGGHAFLGPGPCPPVCGDRDDCANEPPSAASSMSFTQLPDPVCGCFAMRAAVRP